VEVANDDRIAGQSVDKAAAEFFVLEFHRLLEQPVILLERHLFERILNVRDGSLVDGLHPTREHGGQSTSGDGSVHDALNLDAFEQFPPKHVHLLLEFLSQRLQGQFVQVLQRGFVGRGLHEGVTSALVEVLFDELAHLVLLHHSVALTIQLAQSPL